MASAMLGTSWRFPGRFQEPSRKDPGKRKDIAKRSTFPPDILPGNIQEGYPDILPSFLPACFLENSGFGGDILEDACFQGPEASCLPGIPLEDSNYPASFQEYPDFRIFRRKGAPGNFQETPRKRPGRIQFAWKVPGNGCWEYPVRLEVPWELPGNFQEGKWHA
eukprot:gene15179-biopygen217